MYYYNSSDLDKRWKDYFCSLRASGIMLVSHDSGNNLQQFNDRAKRKCGINKI